MRRAKSGVALCYDAILLLQLRNGLRISEAVRAFKHFLRSHSAEFKVSVSKRRRAEERLVVVPRELLGVSSKCKFILEIEDSALLNRIKAWCLYTHKFNTHSLRYAFITYLLRRGVDAATIAKITKHSRLAYTQKKITKEIGGISSGSESS